MQCSSRHEGAGWIKSSDSRNRPAASAAERTDRIALGGEGPTPVRNRGVRFGCRSSGIRECYLYYTRLFGEWKGGLLLLFSRPEAEGIDGIGRFVRPPCRGAGF